MLSYWMPSSLPLFSPVGVGLVAVGVTTAALAAMRALKSAGAGDEDGEGVVRLLEFECTMTMMDQVAISTVTFMRGDPASASAFLSNRVGEIVAANPWLAGRLCRGRSGYLLRWDPAKAPPSLFHAHPHDPSGPPMARGTDYEGFVEAAQRRGMLLDKGQDSVGRDKGLFRVSLIPDSSDPSGRFALVVSMCHAIADGHTYYTIRNMLSSNRSVKALDPRRVHTAHADSEQAMQGPGGLSRPSGWFLVNMIASVIRMHIGKRAKAAAHFIDKGYVTAKKLEAAEEGKVAYVSCNDVASSAVFQASPKAHTLLMAINFRNKLPCINDTHAGNYENLIMYRHPDVTSPSLIRLSVQNKKRSSSPPTTLISGPSHLGEIFSCTTNWSSFDLGLQLQGCTEDLHLPLYDYKNVTPPAFLIAIIFRPRQGETALFSIGPDDFIQQVIASGVTGKRLDIPFRSA